MRKFYFIILLFVSNYILAQESIYVEYDPSTIAFGNSSVANIYSRIPTESNPALLSEQKGISIFYAKRNINWFRMIEDLYYSSLGISLETSIGNFGLTYKNYNLGELVFITPEGPFGDASAEVYDYSISISYARKFFNELLSVGASIKTFGHHYSNLSGLDIEENFPVAFDFGILCSESFINKDFEKLFFGCSVHNIGTKYTAEKKYIDDPIGGSTENEIKYPQIFKIGFSYLVTPFEKINITPISILFSASLNTSINSDEVQYPEDKFKSLGLDINFFEIASFRLGAVIYDESNGVYGRENKFNWRYGFGININPEKYGINIPISLSFNYTWIPLDMDNIASFFYSMIRRENLDAFNFTISYNNSFF